MIVCYSKTGKTKVFAEELSKLTGMKLFELAEERPHKGFFGSFRGAWDAVRGKESKVKALPDLAGVKKIFVCSPIWAGSVAPAARYFMNHADLTGVEVSFLTTCGNPGGCRKYADDALAAFAASGKNGVPGAAYGFVTAGKKPVDRETIREQMRKMITDR
ncbi:MAG: hypothetical protein FWC55_00270 [Firmicutes bacterium]|nr:hypothetical protein [Bacillota bacterium]